MSFLHCIILPLIVPPVGIPSLPEANLPSADERRQAALDIFEKCHIAPSYRRLLPTWTTCISLLLDLLLGAGKTRYLCTRPTTRHHKEVFVRGFSAGSYSGICLLHLLWKLPHIDARGKLGGMACPPEPVEHWDITLQGKTSRWSSILGMRWLLLSGS